ncbi:MAG: pentapeptide repeat-containing protein [Candidatus Nanopelagicales bacterium]|nr:pentapeptide repeat-containing protein [Candidatus Nanopelagicales bacterium]MDZ4250002.1 pentapeptide repeat-containing protein [Candidatus Nanopelagicales bacterium]MDZ7578961.1 pentapeptide repeat-containing protein [Candidatus Nanopelagicales bacterium]
MALALGACAAPTDTEPLREAGGPTASAAPTLRDCFEIPKAPDANLADCDLTGASLSGADLTGANLREASLSRANLTGAIWVDGRTCVPSGSHNECL